MNNCTNGTRRPRYFSFNIIDFNNMLCLIDGCLTKTPSKPNSFTLQYFTSCLHKVCAKGGYPFLFGL